MRRALGSGVAVTEKAGRVLPGGYVDEVDIRLVRETASRGRWWRVDPIDTGELLACVRGTLGGAYRPGEDELFRACLQWARAQRRTAS